MKKINIKKPSSFFVKSKSQAGIRRDQRKVTDLNSRAERDMDLYMTGKISKEELIRRKELNGAELEKIIDKGYIKTYSVLVTEEELRLFSEFLEKQSIDRKYDSDRFNSWEAQVYGDEDKENFKPFKGSKYHRMTVKYIEGKDPSLQNAAYKNYKASDNMHLYGPDLLNVPEEYKKAKRLRDRAQEEINKEGSNILSIRDSEVFLRDNGYDDVYSSKLVEKIRDKKITPRAAKEIAKKREEVAFKYENLDNFKSSKDRFKKKKLRRKLADAKIVWDATKKE